MRFLWCISAVNRDGHEMHRVEMKATSTLNSGSIYLLTPNYGEYATQEGIACTLRFEARPPLARYYFYLEVMAMN